MTSRTQGGGGVQQNVTRRDAKCEGEGRVYNTSTSRIPASNLTTLFMQAKVLFTKENAVVFNLMS